MAALVVACCWCVLPHGMRGCCISRGQAWTPIPYPCTGPRTDDRALLSCPSSHSFNLPRPAAGSDDLSVRVWYVGKPTAPPGNALAKAAVIVAAEMAQMDQQQQQQRSSSGALLQKVASGVEQGSPRGSCQGVQRSRSGGSGGSGGGGGEDGGGEAPARPGSCLLVLEGHHRKVQCVAWAHDGGRLASGGCEWGRGQGLVRGRAESGCWFGLL